MHRVKRFFKELKRVRWPEINETNSAFFKSIIFIIVASLVLFGLGITFVAIWNALGIGT